MPRGRQINAPEKRSRAKALLVVLLALMLVVVAVVISTHRSARHAAAKRLVEAEQGAPRALSLIKQYRSAKHSKPLSISDRRMLLDIVIASRAFDAVTEDADYNYTGLAADAEEKVLDQLREARSEARRLGLRPEDIARAKAALAAEERAKKQAEAEEEAARKREIVRQVAGEMNLSEEEVSRQLEMANSVTVINWDWGYDDGSRYIGGIVKNNTDKTLSYAEVDFNLYDAGGAQVGTAMDNVTNLDPRGSWKFRAVVVEDDATSAKLEGAVGH